MDSYLTEFMFKRPELSQTLSHVLSSPTSMTSLLSFSLFLAIFVCTFECFTTLKQKLKVQKAVTRSEYCDCYSMISEHITMSEGDVSTIGMLAYCMTRISRKERFQLSISSDTPLCQFSKERAYVDVYHLIHAHDDK
jgi:hypothetical protein